VEQFWQIRFGGLSPEERNKIYGASQLALSNSGGQLARAWLSKRGLDRQTISEFRLGYVPFEWSHAFCGRIVIPIFDAYSNLLALSVRPVSDDKELLKEFKKYWNEHYEKGWHLFGLNLARKSIIQNGFAIIVEGQFDVMTMHAFGFTNTIGVLGGAFTPMHAEIIKKWTTQLVVMFDGDAPGKKHAERCLDILSYYKFSTADAYGRINRNNVFGCANVTLPNEDDPSNYVCQFGSIEMKKILYSAMKKNNMLIPKSLYLKEQKTWV
jgi:DNA primase